MSATYPERLEREGSHVDESRIDSELEHQLRRRNVAHAEREAADQLGEPEPGNVAASGPAAGEYPSTGASTAHSFDTQPKNSMQEQLTPTPTVPLPDEGGQDAALQSSTPADGASAAALEINPAAQSAETGSKDTPPANAADSTAANATAPGTAPGTTGAGVIDEEGKERSCRICFGGVDEEGEMGRLMSPCLCSGSMRYVHVQCLAMWRAKNSKTFLECPQCKYTYVLRRGKWGDFILSSRALSLATAATFISMSLITGHFLLHFLLNLYQKGSHSSSAMGSTWESEDGTMVVYMGGATFILDLIDDSINAFIAITAQAFDMFEGSRWVSPLMLDFILRFLLGVALLGALSALSLLGSLRLLAPLQLIYTISLSGVISLDPVLSALGGSRSIIVGFVLLGVANSIVQVYDALHACAMFGLRFVESEIVEPTREQVTQTQEARTWGRRWLQDRKWRSVEGWQEVWRRFRDKYKRRQPLNDPGREVLVQMAAQAQPQPDAAAAQPAEPAAVVVDEVNAVAPAEGAAPVLPAEPAARHEVEILDQ
ncbi:hypothetical protein A1Q1_02091 [Trichosporon asahii var. asahii CBS 2479]|nr:hypothetical protein A1Q1_02091 [Trichosporon asahii var. asahii CBS 2479]EJT52756.1 hypothetical protein A1Q1_02091 [Trichosporon asahii var. asahii CBS 2479]